MKLSDLEFPPEQSEFGSDKLRMFRQAAIVLPRFEGVTPAWRITWERLQDFLRTSIAEQAERMRSMPIGAESGDQLESIGSQSGYVHLGQYFVDQMLQQLSAQFEDYNAEFGFDMDLFLIVYPDMQEQTAKTVIHCELFPRRAAGVPEKAFASRVILPQGQWHEITTAAIGKTDNTLVGLIFAERTDNAARDMEPFWREFCFFKGMWEIRTRPCIDAFIGRLIFSMLAPYIHGEVVGGNVRHVEGEPFKANLVRTVV